MANTKISELMKGVIVFEKEDGIIRELLNSEFESGKFLERQKLYKEFVAKLKPLLTNEVINVYTEVRKLIEEYEVKKQKWDLKI